MSPQDTVERIQNDLITEAPDGFLGVLIGTPKLQEALQAFKDEAINGLTVSVPDFETRLNIRKRDVVAATPTNAYTIERLLARAVDAVLRAARGGV